MYFACFGAIKGLKQPWFFRHSQQVHPEELPERNGSKGWEDAPGARSSEKDISKHGNLQEEWTSEQLEPEQADALKLGQR